MSIAETVNMSLRSLWRNPGRTLLTMLGIIIGIGAVIAMMEVGNGSSISIRESIEKMGAKSGIIRPGSRRISGVKLGSGSSDSLSPEDTDYILRHCPHVQMISPVIRGNNLQVIFGSENWVPAQMFGVSPAYFTIRDWTIDEGRFFTDRETERNARVCVVGSTIVSEVFHGMSPIDCEIRIGNVNFRVVGVLNSKGANMMGMDEDDVILMPWTTMRMRITGRKSGNATFTSSTLSTTPGAIYPVTGVAFYPEQSDLVTNDALISPKFIYIDQITFSSASVEEMALAIQEVTAALREKHHLRSEEDDDFRIHSSSEFMKMMDKTSMLMSNLLLGVALLSLLVGGVGIMNIMLVSVTERTREIGLRMAVGARSRDILKQFLIESIVMCLAGGIIGILTGYGIAWLIHTQLHWPVASSPSAVVAAFAVSVGIGIIFGFYPAWKASRLDPIDALRYE